MADFTIDETVDITDVVCPMTFVKKFQGRGTAGIKADRQ